MFTQRQKQRIERDTQTSGPGAVHAGNALREGGNSHVGTKNGPCVRAGWIRFSMVAAASLLMASVGIAHGQDWAPDLRIMSITTDPPNPAVGQPFDVIVQIGNYSEYYNAGPFSISLHSELASEPTSMCSNSELTVNDNDGLLAWTSDYYRVDDSFYYNTAGAHAFWAWADACNYVDESDDLNNKDSLVIQVGQPAQPDLIVARMEPLTVPALGVQFQMRVKLENPTNTPTGPFRLLIDRNRTSTPNLECVAEELIPVDNGLAANGVFIRDIPVTYSSVGSHTFWARVDGCGQVSESNESNNRLSLTTLIPGPDLVVESISAPPSFILVNSSLAMTAWIRNDGGVASNACFGQVFKNRAAAPTLSCSGDIPVNIPSIPAGERRLISFSVSYDTAGDKRLWLWADSCPLVSELNENNNQRSTIVRVRRGANLVIDSITPTDSPVRQLNSTSVDVVIRNAGDVATPTGSEITVHGFLNSAISPTCLSFDRVGTSTGSLAAGATRTVRLTNITYWLPGQHTFRVSVDPCDNIRESSGADNSLGRVIDVHLPL